MTLTPGKVKVMTKPHAKNQNYRSSGSGQRVERLFIGVLKKKKEKEKDNQDKLKEAMAIAIGLIMKIHLEPHEHFYKFQVRFFFSECGIST